MAELFLRCLNPKCKSLEHLLGYHLQCWCLKSLQICIGTGSPGTGIPHSGTVGLEWTNAFFFFFFHLKFFQLIIFCKNQDEFPCKTISTHSGIFWQCKQQQIDQSLTPKGWTSLRWFLVTKKRYRHPIFRPKNHDFEHLGTADRYYSCAVDPVALKSPNVGYA